MALTTVQDEYFSGQGNFLVAERDANGNPKGFKQLGNIPSAELSVEITKYEHKESRTGNRLTDLTIVQEKRGTFTLTLENISPFNLALAFWGETSVIAGAAVVDEAIYAYQGLRQPGANPNWNASVVPTLSAAGTIAAWQAGQAYSVGALVTGTGSPDDERFWMATTAGTSDASEPTWSTAAGDTVTDNTVEWTDMGLIDLVADDDFEVDYEHGVIEFASDADITDGQEYKLGYTHLGGNVVDAFMNTSQQRWIRFEGLNTVDGNQVVVDIYKADLDPLSGFGLINEEIASMEVSGSMLLDSTKPTSQSQLFRKFLYSTAS